MLLIFLSHKAKKLSPSLRYSSSNFQVFFWSVFIHSQNWNQLTLYWASVVFSEAFLPALFSMSPSRAQRTFSRNQDVQNPPTNRQGLNRKNILRFTPPVFTEIRLMCLVTEAINEWKVKFFCPAAAQTWHIYTMTSRYCVASLTYYFITARARAQFQFHNTFANKLQYCAVIKWTAGNGRCFEDKNTFTA